MNVFQFNVQVYLILVSILFANLLVRGFHLITVDVRYLAKNKFLCSHILVIYFEDRQMVAKKRNMKLL